MAATWTDRDADDLDLIELVIRSTFRWAALTPQQKDTVIRARMQLVEKRALRPFDSTVVARALVNIGAVLFKP